MSTVSAITYGSVSSSGVVLSLPHSTGLQSSLPLLQKNYKLTKVFFWGKITGTSADYLIAMGTEESYANKKFFFWCAAKKAPPPHAPPPLGSLPSRGGMARRQRRAARFPARLRAPAHTCAPRLRAPRLRAGSLPGVVRHLRHRAAAPLPAPPTLTLPAPRRARSSLAARTA
jgi:hypothetical protein